MEWEIRTLNAAPGMSETIAAFTGTYEQACQKARDSFAKTGRRTAVVRDMYYWFTIRNGVETDFNRRGETCPC
jgi:hypothetical protein